MNTLKQFIHEFMDKSTRNPESGKQIIDAVYAYVEDHFQGSDIVWEDVSYTNSAIQWIQNYILTSSGEAINSSQIQDRFYQVKNVARWLTDPVWQAETFRLTNELKRTNGSHRLIKECYKNNISSLDDLEAYLYAKQGTEVAKNQETDTDKNEAEFLRVINIAMDKYKSNNLSVNKEKEILLAENIRLKDEIQQLSTQLAEQTEQIRLLEHQAANTTCRLSKDHLLEASRGKYPAIYEVLSQL